MTTVAIDTHKAILLLTKQGFSQAQAEGVVEVLRESGFVTDVSLDSKLSELRADIYRAMMVQGGVIISMLTGIIALFFGV